MELIIRAENLCRKGKLGDAERVLEDCLQTVNGIYKINSNFLCYWIYYSFGDLYSSNHQAEKAKENYLKVIKIGEDIFTDTTSPVFVQCIYNLAQIFHSDEDSLQAEELYDKGIKLIKCREHDQKPVLLY